MLVAGKIAFIALVASSASPILGQGTAPGSVLDEHAEALAQAVDGVCDDLDSGCAEGLSLRQLRAKPQAQVSLAGASLGSDDLHILPSKAVLVQGSGLLLGPRAFVEQLAEVAGADADGEEPFSIDCKRVQALPQLTFALSGGESLVVESSEYTSQRADGHCVLTALTLDESNSAGAAWVLGDFARPAVPALAQEHWSWRSAATSLGGCSACQQAAASAGSESAGEMCKSTCHSYGIPFGCSHICKKVEKKLCGVSDDDSAAPPNCGDALCSYFLPSCTPSGSQSGSGGSHSGSESGSGGAQSGSESGSGGAQSGSESGSGGAQSGSEGGSGGYDDNDYGGNNQWGQR